MSRCIREILRLLNEKDIQGAFQVAQRLDKLLREALHHVDDENLYDRIRQEVERVE